MTNAHCIPGEEGDGDVREASLLMGYLSQLDEAAAVRYDVDPNPVETDAELDYSILRVFDNPSANWGTVTIVAEDPDPAAALILIGHPEGRPKMVTRGNCRAAAPEPNSGNDFLHECDSLGGSSGSPVLRDLDGAAIGLHHAGTINPTEFEFNFAVRMTRIAAASPIVTELAVSGGPQPTATFTSPVAPPG